MEASRRYGFNPLTLLQYGQTGGSAQGASPPLASNELLMGALQDVTDLTTGETAQRRAANQMELDLGQIKLDQMRSGVAAVGIGPSPLGLQASPVVTPRNVAFSGGLDGEDARRSVLLTAGDVPPPAPYLDRGTGLFAAGFHLKPAPGWSSGQAFENEYGETPLSWPYAGLKMSADVGYNIGNLQTEAEVALLKMQGRPVFSLGGQYFSQQPDPVKPFRKRSSQSSKSSTSQVSRYN